MKKSTKIVLLVFLGILCLGLLLIGAGLLTGGNVARLTGDVEELFQRIDYDTILRAIFG
jgi:hypothetical protein